VTSFTDFVTPLIRWDDAKTGMAVQTLKFLQDRRLAWAAWSTQTWTYM